MFVAVVALVAVAALPPMDKLVAVPVKPVPAPVNVVALTAAVTVPPIVVPLIVPPVIATLDAA
jgi:hypothetical protein